MDYSSNIILELTNNEKEPRIQATYASQLYGTFFGVFSRFYVQPIKGSNDRVVTKIKFFLINYKGEKNLKIITPFDKPKKSDNDDIPGWVIDLKVQHNINANSFQENVELDLTRFFPETNGMIVKDEDFITLYRVLIPMNGHIANDPKQHWIKRAFNNGVFDSECFKRDGYYVNERKKFEYSDDTFIGNQSGSYPSLNCVPSNNKIIFM
ncbi:hypothetical protein [Aquimarina megaterium]|uniref:hypothetical protein n=1 Tax=Aquimarina megaterium TaxID=1443666 RepID=UPI00046E7E54|nr:hypothetical protein [Aquimarina megaterium]